MAARCRARKSGTVEPDKRMIFSSWRAACGTGVPCAKGEPIVKAGLRSNLQDFATTEPQAAIFRSACPDIRQSELQAVPTSPGADQSTQRG
jgi:hypothetical protein